MNRGVIKMLIREIMKKELITVTPDTSLKDAAKKMKDENVGCILVTENGGLNGILTDRDITCMAVAEGKDPGSTLVKEIMKANPVFVGPDTDIFEAFKMMAEHSIRRLPIEWEGKLEGMVTISDLAAVLKEEMDNFFDVTEVYHH